MTKQSMKYEVDGMEIELKEVNISNCHAVYNIIIDGKKEGELNYYAGNGWTFFVDSLFIDQNWRGYDFEDIVPILLREISYAALKNDLQEIFDEDN